MRPKHAKKLRVEQINVHSMWKITERGNIIMGTTNCGGGKAFTAGNQVECVTPVANLLRNMAEDIAERAQDTERRFNVKISPIMNDILPEVKDQSPPTQVWPPLFSQLRDQLDLIKVALNSINTMIDRVEL